jgi:predicted O-methyltransferase YrrM
MRQRQTPLTNDLLEYIENNFGEEDDFLKELVVNSWEYQGIPQINITSWQANFLFFLIKTIDARNILEIGTLAGYSAIVMARAASPDAKILTIEKSELHSNYAKQKIEEANISNIEIVNADARKYLEQYNPEQPLDMVFLDADKSNYKKYVDLITPHLRKGGILIADNAFAFGFLLASAPERNPAEVRSMLGFHKYMLSLTEYYTTIVPIGDGMLLSIKQ